MVLVCTLAIGPLLACEWVGGNGARTKFEKDSKESLHKMLVLILTNLILEHLLACICIYLTKRHVYKNSKKYFPSTLEELSEGTDFNYSDGQPFLPASQC